MPEHEKVRSRLLRRVKRQRLKYVAILPSFITLINGLCGFAALGFASRTIPEQTSSDSLNFFAMSGYMIFIAMIADALDGRVARMSQTTSSFGGQLDSLCDMISFGAAPAFLMLKVLRYNIMQAQFSPVFTLFLERFVWLAAGAYVACTAIRLARFNVENEEDETSHMSFMGLPSPAAAGVIASIVVFYNMIPDFAEKHTWLYWGAEKSIVGLLPFVTLGAALLMVSRIRYPHLVNQYMKGKKPIEHLGWVLGILLMLVLYHQVTLLLGFSAFAVSGVVRLIYCRFAKKATPKIAEGTGNSPTI
jgi:CDP-diacylglycerol--serine O-phosphatidyltransferase